MSTSILSRLSISIFAVAHALGCQPSPQGEVASESGVTSQATETSSSSGSEGTSTTGIGTSGETGDETGVVPTGPPTPGPLQAGAAVAYLEGPVGVSMAGYGLRTVNNETTWNDQLNGSRGFHGLPSIKAIVLEAAGERLVLIKLPTMSSEASLTEGIADKLEQLYGVDLRGRIITGATHSHHSQARYWRLPEALGLIGADSPDEEVIDRMTTAFATTIKAALDDLGPAQWAYGSADDWDPEDHVYRDRRAENDPTYGKDPRLTLLAIRRPGGEALATVINFATHGTVFGADNELLTEDAAGGLEMVFEEAFFAATGSPIVGMFIQSGGGDASPGGGQLGHPDPQRIEMIGHAAAPTIIELYNGLEWRDQAALRVRSRRIDLTYERFGYDRIPEFRSPGGLDYIWGAWQCAGEGVDDNNPATSLEGKGKQCSGIAGLLTSLGESSPHGEFHQVYLSSAVIDELALVSLPGEPTYSVIKYLRSSLADRDLEALAFGYSQDHLLYLTHPDDWFQGGYETEMSLWGPFAAQTLVDLQIDLVDDLMAGVPGPDFSEESPNLSLAQEFTARAVEASEDPVTVLEDPQEEVSRLDTASFTWGGGDPSVDTPHVVAQRLVDGSFIGVPSPSGQASEWLDNRRYHMITSFSADPPLNGEIAASRKHHWRIDWELPIDLPAGHYRLVASGEYWDGDALHGYELESSVFAVVQSPTINTVATLDGGQLSLKIDLPTLAEDIAPGASWLRRGYRLQDPKVGPGGPLGLRAPLIVAFTVDGVDDKKNYELTFDENAGTYLFDFAATGLGSEGLEVRYHLSADIEPSFTVAPVEVL